MLDLEILLSNGSYDYQTIANYLEIYVRNPWLHKNIGR